MSTVDSLSGRLRAVWSKLALLVKGRRALSDDLAAEIQSCLDLEADDRVAQGLTPEEARLVALRRSGNATLAKERARDAWTFPRLETFFQDLRYGLRSMRRAPAFFLIVVLTLALGIGANTAIFSVVNAVLLKSLPYPNADRLVVLGESTKKAEGFSVTWGNYRSWQKYNHSFEDMAGRETARFTLTGLPEPLFTSAGVVTHEFFGLTGAKPILGRVFTAEEDQAGAERTVVLDYSFWTAKLGSDGGILGKTLALDGQAYRVIGVLAPGLRFFGRPMDFYVPLGLSHRDSAPRGQHGSIRALARLKPGVTLSAARADLDEIMQRLAQSDPGSESDHRSSARFLSEETRQPVRTTLLMMMGAVGLVLLIACANVASLLLSRGASRNREIAIRTAIGAGRKRLARQLLTENLLAASIGGVCGVLLALWGQHALIAAAPRGIPRLDEASLDPGVMLFAAGLVVLTGLLVGFAPVMTAGRVDLAAALNSGGKSATSSRRDQRFRNAMVVAEIAITLVLAFSSGLLLRSLIAAQDSNPGFARENLLAAELVLPASAYRDGQAVSDFYDRLERNLRALPGATEVSKVFCPPSTGDCMDWFYSAEGAPVPARGDVPIALFNRASPGYFQTMRIPLREGREFSPADRKGAPRVAMVNETLARKWWPHASAVGRHIKSGGPYMEGPLYEIVGVAGNVSQEGLDATPLPEVYLPFAQSVSEAMVVMVRTAGDPAALIPGVRNAVLSEDRNLAIRNMGPFDRRVEATLNRRRFGTWLLAAFAGLALTLAAVGVYGLLSYWVTAREHEIALRMALGARKSDILHWAGLDACVLIGLGTLLGAGAAWAASHWLDSLVYGISARSTIMMAAAAVVVTGTAVLAAAIPLARAARVDVAGKLQRA